MRICMVSTPMLDMPIGLNMNQMMASVFKQSSNKKYAVNLGISIGLAIEELVLPN